MKLIISDSTTVITLLNIERGSFWGWWGHNYKLYKYEERFNLFYLLV